MKKTFTLLILSALMVLTAHGETIDVDSLRYTLNSDGTATVSECLYKSTPDINIPSSVSDGTTTYTVTKIGQYAFDQKSFITSVTFPETMEYMDFCSFRWCSGLTQVTIPASLKELSSSNFSQCTNLETVTIAAGSQLTKVDEAAFYNCYKLTSINLPSTVTEIGTSAFIYCKGLTTFTMPASLTTLKSSAFNGCKGLTSITLPSGVTTISNSAFYDCTGLTEMTIPSSVTTIESSAFYGCTGLTEISIPSNVTTIGGSAFYGCNGLTSVTIPAMVTTMGEYVFSHCKGLTSATIAGGVTSLPRDLFSECTKLESVSIPQSVTSIGQGVFYLCTALGNITLPANLTEIGSYAFYGTPITTMTLPATVTSIGEYAFRECSKLESINLPNGITKISQHLLYGCSSLKSLTLPDGITEIGNYAFRNCKLITELTIPSNVEKLGQSVFEDCTGLTAMTLPNSVTIVGSYLFKNCTGLTSVTLPNNLNTITYAMFNGCKALTAIDIPASVTKIEGYAFEGCTALNEAVIPETVTSIGEGLFKDCTSLEKATLPDNITQLPYHTFYGCTALQSFNWPAQLTTIAAAAFSGSKALCGDIVLPQSVKIIKYSAFQDCDQMKSITLPDELTTLEEDVFYGCDSLQTIIFPKNLTTIPRDLCGYCRQLQNITFPEELETIDAYAFQYCGLKGTLTLPATLKTIKDHAFYRCEMEHIAFQEGIQTIKSGAFQSCESLLEVTLPASLAQLEGYAFDDCDNLLKVTFPADVTNLTFTGRQHFSYNKQLRSITFPQAGMTTIPEGMFAECDRLRQVELPTTLTSIGKQAFYGCDSLQTIYIPDGVTAIGDEAFDYCKKLKYARLPEGLQTIGSGCFAWNENLQYLNIPSTVTSIGNYALHTTGTTSNTSFKSLGIMGTTMPTTGEHVFYYMQPALTLLVPEGQGDSYQNSASWTPHGTDNRIIKSYPAEKQTMTQDLIHLSCLNGETYLSGGPEAIYVDWFEGMGNYRVYYTDSKNNKTATMPTKGGSYSISLEFEEGPYYKPATFNDIATFNVQEIADEDFALLWDFYNTTYDPTGAKNTWAGGGGNGVAANWKLIKGVKESAHGIFGVKWNQGHVEEINFGTGTSIYNLNANETPACLFALPKVKKIEIANGELYGNISEKVEEWLAAGKTLSPTLEYLDLQRNKLTGNISTLANALPALKTLDLHENRFSTVWPALSETLENINISNQTITDIVATVDLRDMTEAGFFSTLPSIVFYDPDTRTYADNISIGVQSQTNWGSFTVNYNASNDFTITGNCTWKGASGDIAKCSYTDSKNKTTNFNANFFYDMGDVDFNGLLNISDLQQSINYLFKESYSGYSRYNFTAGDLNADNAINVLDIVPHVDLLLGLTPNHSPMGEGSNQSRWMTRSNLNTQKTQCAEASLYIKDGKLILNTSRPVAALDIIIGNEGTKERGNENSNLAFSSLLSSLSSVSQRQLTDGKLHLIIYSTSGKTLPVGISTIGTCSNNATITNAMLVDEEAVELNAQLNDATAVITGIESLNNSTNSPLDNDTPAYNLSGQRVGKSYKGVVIKNGKKVVIK